MSCSTESPARILVPLRMSASSATRSSSARPTIMARLPSSSSSLKVTTSPVSSGVRASTTLSDSLSTTSAPRVRSSPVRSGWTETRILRPPENTSTVPSSLVPEQGAVGRRRLGELLDLVAQGGDVLARLAQGVGELLVLGDGLGQLALGLEQALLEGAHPLGGVLQPPPQRDDLLLEQPWPARAARPAHPTGRRRVEPVRLVRRPSLTGITSSDGR